MADLKPGTRWMLAGMIVLAILVYIVLNWRAVSEPLSGVLRALLG